MYDNVFLWASELRFSLMTLGFIFTVIHCRLRLP